MRLTKNNFAISLGINCVQLPVGEVQTDADPVVHGLRPVAPFGKQNTKRFPVGWRREIIVGNGRQPHFEKKAQKRVAQELT